MAAISTFDVIIIGGGGSGLAAAVSAAERGCKVLLLEKQIQLGGTTGVAVGPFAWFAGCLHPFIPRFIVNAFIHRLMVTWQHPENALFDDGAILINVQGKRFCDETKWPEREISIANQKDKLAFILLNERLIERYSTWPHYISTAPRIVYAYAPDYLKLRPDIAFASTL